MVAGPRNQTLFNFNHFREPCNHPNCVVCLGFSGRSKPNGGMTDKIGHESRLATAEVASTWRTSERLAISEWLVCYLVTNTIRAFPVSSHAFSTSASGTDLVVILNFAGTTTSKTLLIAESSPGKG